MGVVTETSRVLSIKDLEFVVPATPLDEAMRGLRESADKLGIERPKVITPAEQVWVDKAIHHAVTQAASHSSAPSGREIQVSNELLNPTKSQKRKLLGGMIVEV